MSIFIILFLTKKSFRYSFYVTVTESSGNLERSRHCKQKGATNAIAPTGEKACHWCSLIDLQADTFCKPGDDCYISLFSYLPEEDSMATRNLFSALVTVFTQNFIAPPP